MFKKFLCIYFMICLFFLVGCNNTDKKKENNNKEQITKKQDSKNKEDVKDKYIDDNPIIVGLYENYSTLVKDYYTSKTNNKDLVFSTFFTNDQTLVDGYLKYKWNYYYNKYNNIDDYKIGYTISFYVDDYLITKTITEITDEYIVSPFMYVYLYDDINQVDGAWYSHLTKDDVTENTIFTSIKLYLVAAQHIDSPINLTVFTYKDSNDFDENGNYRGNSKYQININWTN